MIVGGRGWGGTKASQTKTRLLVSWWDITQNLMQVVITIKQTKRNLSVKKEKKKDICKIIQYFWFPPQKKCKYIERQTLCAFRRALMNMHAPPFNTPVSIKSLQKYGERSYSNA